jgi:hypothetical protein
MTREDAAAFDDGVRALVRASGQSEVIVDCVAEIAWGVPLACGEISVPERPIS